MVNGNGKVKVSSQVKIGDVTVGGNSPLFLISGPCVIENKEVTLKAARFLKELAEKVKIPVIFKSSYDKANRTSIDSFRGPGLTEGLEILREVKDTTGLPVLSKTFSIKLTILKLHIMVNLYRTHINHLLADMNGLVNIVMVKTELIF